MLMFGASQPHCTECNSEEPGLRETGQKIFRMSFIAKSVYGG